MLFTDGPFVTAKDLTFIDSEFITLANDNKINVDGSSDSVIYHSMLSAGAEFTGAVQNFSGYLVGVGVNSNHLAAVLNILSTAINRPRALLNQIVVKEPNVTRSAFIRWVRFYVLHDFYRDLALRKTKEERFALKMGMYAAERKRHFGILCNNGFPVLLAPLDAPGAIWSYGSGSWGASNATLSAGGSDTGATYSVAITWVSIPGWQSYYNQNGSESGPSAYLNVVAAANQIITVNINGLNPPSGLMQPAIGTASGVFAPMQATNWNVWVGLAGGPLYLQNSAPLPITQTTFACAGPPILTGDTLNPGQPAQYDFSFQRVLWRA